MNPGDRRPAGFSLLELVVVISIVGLLAAFALDRYAEYQRQADRAAMRNVELGLKTALTLEAAHIAQHLGASHLKRLEMQNPFDLLAEKPLNYSGLLPADPAAVRPGHWYYDAEGKEIVHVRRARNDWFESSPAERVIYRVIVKYGTGGAEAALLVPIGGEEGKSED